MRRMIWILCSALLAGSCSHLAVAATRRAAESLDFLVVGDWGGQDTEPYYTTGERNVARAMGVTAAKIGSEFTIGLGDNFYDDGVTDVTDPRFRETFEVREPHPRRRMIHCAIHVHLYELSACRTCSRPARCSRAGILCAETMTTGVTPLRRWSTQSSLRGGTCLACTTRRYSTNLMRM